MDATSRKYCEATFEGADGEVAHTETLLFSTSPSAAFKVGFAEIFLMPQPPLLTEEGNSSLHRHSATIYFRPRSSSQFRMTLPLLAERMTRKASSNSR